MLSASYWIVFFMSLDHVLSFYVRTPRICSSWMFHHSYLVCVRFARPLWTRDLFFCSGFVLCVPSPIGKNKWRIPHNCQTPAPCASSLAATSSWQLCETRTFPVTTLWNCTCAASFCLLDCTRNGVFFVCTKFCEKGRLVAIFNSVERCPAANLCLFCGLVTAAQLESIFGMLAHGVCWCEIPPSMLCRKNF